MESAYHGQGRTGCGGYELTSSGLEGSRCDASHVSDAAHSFPLRRFHSIESAVYLQGNGIGAKEKEWTKYRGI